MKYAYIENNTVKDVAQVDPFSIFYLDYAKKFIEIPNYVDLNWVLVSGEWIEPVKNDNVSKEQQQAARAEAYRIEADPIFFKSQRGEAEIAEWEAKVAEIRVRYPYPEE